MQNSNIVFYEWRLHMKIRFLALFLLLVMAALLLAACGGEGDVTTPADTGAVTTTAAGGDIGDGAVTTVRTEPTPPVTSTPVTDPVEDDWCDPFGGSK